MTKSNKPARATFLELTTFFRNDLENDILAKIPKEILRAHVNIFEKQLDKGYSAPLITPARPNGNPPSIVITANSKYTNLNGLDPKLVSTTNKFKKLFEFAADEKLGIVFSTDNMKMLITPERVATYAAISLPQDHLVVTLPSKPHYGTDAIDPCNKKQLTKIMHSKEWVTKFGFYRNPGYGPEHQISFKPSKNYSDEYIAKEIKFLERQIAATNIQVELCDSRFKGRTL